jgi:hypothetical protein
MPPSQPQYPQQSPYDFIVNSGQPQPKRPFSLPNGGSKRQRILLIAGGGFTLLVLIIMMFSMLSGGSKEQNERLLSIAQQQTEIVRVTNLARDKARTSAAQSLAATTSITMQSSQSDVTGLLKKAGVKTDVKVLALKNDPKTDAALEAAAQNNRYDEVFTELLAREIKEYQTSVKEAYDGTSSKTQKAVLETAFINASTLLGEQK